MPLGSECFRHRADPDFSGLREVSGFVRIAGCGPGSSFGGAAGHGTVPYQQSEVRLIGLANGGACDSAGWLAIMWNQSTVVNSGAARS